jgi:hypothetical protein
MSTLLVMAAGLGSRYGGVKQVDRVGPHGEMLVDYGLFDARRAGFSRIVFVIRPDLDEAFADLIRRLPSDLQTACVHQDVHQVPAWVRAPARTRPWGTVHAVLAARHIVETPFAVVNADDFYGALTYRLAADGCAAATRDGIASVVTFPLGATLSDNGPVARAVCDTVDGWLTRIEEVRAIERAPAGARRLDSGAPLTGRERVSMNCWTFPHSAFDLLAQRFEAFLRERGQHDLAAEFPIPDAINNVIRSGRLKVRVREAPGDWFGLTHLTDRALVCERLRELVRLGDYPAPLWDVGR